MTGQKQPWKHIIFCLLGGLLLYLLWWRFQVSSVRFYDVDEFSYMHWTAQIARGQHMYTDFFSYFTPGFMWFFAPIFWVYGVSAHVFAAARMVSFVIFLGILGSLGYVFGITRNRKWALLPVVILAFLPMPYDKFLEIRPDNLATLLAIMGVIAEILALQKHRNVWWFASGLLYSASLLVLAKTLPIVAVGVGIAGIYALFPGPAARSSHPTSSLTPSSVFSRFIVRTLITVHVPKTWVAASLRAVDGSVASRVTLLFLFFIGLFGPWVVFFLGALASGHFGVVWYSLTRLPFEVYKSAVTTPMEANLFFYPNASFYGGNGQSITAGLIVNHVFWLVAIFVGALRLLTPLRQGDRSQAFVELLLGGIFFVSIFGYVKFFPLKHSQYLIPIAVFVAYYAADGLVSLFNWLSRVGGYESLTIVLLGFAYILVSVTRDVNAQKLLSTNTAQMTELTALIQNIPRASRVVDLEGRMVFWPEGYMVSSLPFDTFLSYVSRPPEPLAVYLTEHPADYIYQGDSGRFSTLTPENLAYIQAHYAPVAGFGDHLRRRIK